MRAREPDGERYADLDGVKLHSDRPLATAPYHCEFVEFFFSQCLPEPHSTKQHEDNVGWGLETTPQVLLATEAASQPDEATICRWRARVRSPVLVVHGDKDRICPLRSGEALARATGGSLVVLGGAGHLPHARDPVKVNLLIREFAAYLPARSAP